MAPKPQPKKQKKPRKHVLTLKRKKKQQLYNIAAVHGAKMEDEVIKVLVSWENCKDEDRDWIPIEYCEGSIAWDMVEDYIDANKPELLKTVQWNRFYKGRSKPIGQTIVPQVPTVIVEERNPVLEQVPAKLVLPAIAKLSPEQVEALFKIMQKLASNESTDKTLTEDYTDPTDTSEGLLAELEDYEITYTNFEYWKQQAKNCGCNAFEDIDYSKMKIETREEFMERRIEEVATSMDQISLYDPGTKQLPRQDVFKEGFWHPGKQDQSRNACLIHAVNMMVGGHSLIKPSSLHSSISRGLTCQSKGDPRWSGSMGTPSRTSSTLSMIHRRTAGSVLIWWKLLQERQ
ncbi:hypothetical protein OXYTRIMIC_253 [Oxytricha trifallax]|uniref:Chromo domain-containing protein n=1 Tax=Oxytricha trifallax TaxID=1172189 RepID=A0A073HZG5_9SPIT|nr:hypothetical protein OXYTRIMIC_253 [Oxytricha trifallax]